MADQHTISTESNLASPALPTTTAVTRRSLLGGAGIAVGAAVLASPPSMPGIAPAAAQPVSADSRPLDAAFKRRAFEVREVCASNNEKIPLAPHPTNGDEARYTNKIGSDSRGCRTTNAAKWNKRHGRPSIPLASRAIPLISRKSRSAAFANWSIP
jgi:hypothetical protein